MVESKNSSLQVDLNPGEVKLTVIIGDGQLGGSVVEMKGAVVGGPGTIRNLKLGIGPILQGNTIEVKTLVKDLNKNSNNTSVTYKLSNAKPASQTVTHAVKKHGDAVQYTTKLTFK